MPRLTPIRRTDAPTLTFFSNGPPKRVRGSSPLGNIAAQGLVMMELQTPRLILRKPQGGDLAAYRAYCQSDRTRFTGGPYTVAQSTQKLAAMIGHWDIRGYGRLILCDRFSGRPLGHLGVLHLVDDDVPEMTWTIWSVDDAGRGLAHKAPPRRSGSCAGDQAVDNPAGPC